MSFNIDIGTGVVAPIALASFVGLSTGQTPLAPMSSPTTVRHMAARR